MLSILAERRKKMVKYVHNSNEFEKEVKEGKVVVDFYADWCAPCKMLGPVLESFADKHEDVKVVKVNVDIVPEVTGQFQVYSIPALFLLENGSVTNKDVGLKNINELEKFAKM